MRSRTWVGALLAWVAVVVAVSSLTWLVIDSAGRNVLAQGEDGAVEPLTEPPPTGAAPAPGTAAPRVTLSPASATASPTRDSPSSSTPAATAPPAPAPTTSPAPASQAPEAVTRTWQGSAGTVTVRCVDWRVSLQSASPVDGWRVEVDNRGPEHVEVEFTSGSDSEEDEEDELRVEASCAGGVPRFDVERH